MIKIKIGISKTNDLSDDVEKQTEKRKNGADLSGA